MGVLVTPLRLFGFGASVAGSILLLGLVALFLFVLFLAAWGWAHTEGEIEPPAQAVEPLTEENSVEILSPGKEPERARLNRTEVSNPAPELGRITEALANASKWDGELHGAQG